MALTVFIETSRFDTQAQYANSATIAFDLPTSDSAQLVQAANQGLRRIFQTGFSYQRAGILLPDLLPIGVAQLSLFDTDYSNRSVQLMAALDSINKKHGKNAVLYGAELVNDRWQMRQQFKSPSYTTKWGELLTIQI